MGEQGALDVEVRGAAGAGAPYFEAVEREVRSAAPDARDLRTVRVAFRDASPVNMTLAAWCRLVEELQAGYPGTNTARMLFDVGPALVNQKTVAYAFRFRSCFNLRVGALDAAVLDELARVRAEMDGERFSTFGVELPAGALGATREEAAGRLAGLAAVAPGYVRVTGGAPGEGAQAALAAAGFAPRGGGMFTGSPKYLAWFAAAPQVMGFGAGTVSRYGGEAFRTTDDVAAYTARAGLSMDIYRDLGPA